MQDMQELYAQRLHRYVTANRNGMPDRVPIRPFAAEFTAVHAGMTCQQVTHDYQQAFEESEYGYATAIAVFNFALVMVVTLVVLWWFRRDPAGRRG